VGFPRPGSPSTTRAHSRLVQGQGRPRLAHCVHGADSLHFDGPSASACDRQPQHRRLSCDAISPSTSRLRFGQASSTRSEQSQVLSRLGGHRPPTNGRPHHTQTSTQSQKVPQTRAIPSTCTFSQVATYHWTPPPTLTFPILLLLLLLLHPPLSSPQWHATSFQHQSSTLRGFEQQL
jgi:hypothetical protein